MRGEESPSHRRSRGLLFHLRNGSKSVQINLWTADTIWAKTAIAVREPIFTRSTSIKASGSLPRSPFDLTTTAENYLKLRRIESM